ncbi:MAG: LysE family translocator [Opitutae bacterium]|nr:LysE family translocator [Opitutae bacterium]
MSSHTFWIYTLTCLLLVAAPGPDNLLAVARGLSQGRRAAVVSALASGCGILVHVGAATLGLTALLMASMALFLAVKLVGAAYLLWLGWRALRSRTLISFRVVDRLPLRRVFLTGFLSASLNPKVGIFILAFVPQFLSPGAGPAAWQLAGLGAWFALLTAVGFALMGMCAHSLARWLESRPRLVAGLNIGAGLAFLGAGFSVLTARARAV